jgi:hypothetical protein
MLLTSNIGANVAFLYVYERLLYVNDNIASIIFSKSQYFHAHHLEFSIFFLEYCAGICISCVGKFYT